MGSLALVRLSGTFLLSLLAFLPVLHFLSSHGNFVQLNSTWTRNSTNLVRSSDQSERTPTFIPFPYKSLGSGPDVACTWMTRQVGDRVNASEPLLFPPGGNDDEFYYPDSMQKGILSEGFCMPRTSLHIFSSAEAIECLAGSNVTVAVSGDSYNIQLFIGLADVLLGSLSNREIHDVYQRRAFLNRTRKAIHERRLHNPNFPDIQYVCRDECYGNVKTPPWHDGCSSCINKIVEDHRPAVGVVGAGTHIYKRFGSMAKVTEELKAFTNATHDVILNSPMCSQTTKIPPEYRNQSYVKGLPRVYEQLLPHVAPQKKNVPFLDVFEMTKSCYMENCSSDGGHRARYVNRWKAQLLLNSICEFR